MHVLHFLGCVAQIHLSCVPHTIERHDLICDCWCRFVCNSTSTSSRVLRRGDCSIHFAIPFLNGKDTRSLCAVSGVGNTSTNTMDIASSVFQFCDKGITIEYYEYESTGDAALPLLYPKLFSIGSRLYLHLNFINNLQIPFLFSA